MADVEISYNNSVIASLSDSGTEVLETNGKLMADDVTITYTKSGGGGNYAVTVSLTNPIGSRDFSHCDIYEAETTDFEESMMTTPLATLSSPTGSATVSIPSTSFGIIIVPDGNWGASYSKNNISCTGKNVFIQTHAIFPNASLYLIGGDGTVTLDRVDYSD